MADRIDVSKLTEFVALGAPANTVAVSKLVMFVILEPGDDGGAVSGARVSHVYAQKLRRR